MSIEVGNKLKGKVTGIKKFGAFVEILPSSAIDKTLTSTSSPTDR
jgi:predicted RNA-binding protein with RPS1 domain